MEVLHFIPVTLLVLTGLWLLWPVVSELKHTTARDDDMFDEPADSLAESLFDAWSGRDGRLRAKAKT